MCVEHRQKKIAHAAGSPLRTAQHSAATTPGPRINRSARLGLTFGTAYSCRSSARC